MPNSEGAHPEVFVSYARQDDDPPVGASVSDGWISVFVQNLGRKGLKDRLFFDRSRMGPGAPLGPTLQAALEQSRLFLMLLSRASIESDWCRKELMHFLARHADEATRSSNVIIVELWPFNDLRGDDDHLRCIRDLRSEVVFAPQFWTKPQNRASYRVLGEPSPRDCCDEDRVEYWAALAELREAILAKLAVRGPVRSADVTATSATTDVLSGDAVAKSEADSGRLIGTVLLADTTDDLKGLRNRVRRHLHGEGVLVLPEGDYTAKSLEQFNRQFDRDLARADIFVQLLSPRLARPEEGFAEPLPQSQYTRAKSQERIPILQWCERQPTDDQLKDPRLARLFNIERLQVSTWTQLCSDVVGSLKDRDRGQPHTMALAQAASCSVRIGERRGHGSPYVGLRPFTEDDAALYFGRRVQVDELLIRLGSPRRFVAVIGDSGTGKSSLIAAGLIPALKAGALARPVASATIERAGSGSSLSRWSICRFTPGERPLDRLVEALLRDRRWADDDEVADTARARLVASLASSPNALADEFRRRLSRFEGEALLVVVDQFEEVFRDRWRPSAEAEYPTTQTSAAPLPTPYDRHVSADDEHFVSLLLRCAAADVPIHVVIVMRSDHLGDAIVFPGLPEAINSSVYLAPRLTRDQLRSAIVDPLSAFGGEIDPKLVTRLVNEAAEDDDLPALQHALLRMWVRAGARRSITSSDYESVCAPGEGASHTRLGNAIDDHANQIYLRLSSEQKEIAREVFSALVERRDGRYVRRSQRIGELVILIGAGAKPDLEYLVCEFRSQGLLVAPNAGCFGDDETVDITHESLARNWYRMQQWLVSEERYAVELREWDQRTQRYRDKRGGILDDEDGRRAKQWMEEVGVRRLDASRWASRYRVERSFEDIKQFVRQSVAVAERQRREKMLFRTLALLFVAGIGIVYWHSIQADRQAAIAKASELASTSETLTKDSPDLGLLLALESRRYMPTPKGDALLRAAATSYPVDRVLRAHDGAILDVRPTLNNTRLVTAGADGTARVWDGISGEQVLLLRGHQAAVVSVQPSPDGSWILTASRDATARLWDAVTGEERCVFRGHEHPLFNARFSPDGRAILTASEDATARIWDASTCVASPAVRRHDAAVTDALYSADGTKVVTTSLDKTAGIWEAGSGNHLHTLVGHDGVVHAASISSDGKIVATASSDKTVRLWYTESGDAWGVLRGHEGPVTSVEFSPDGSKVLTASLDRTARLWDVSTGAELQTLRGHGERVSHAHFSSDGSTVLTSSADGTVRLWDGATGVESSVLRGHEGAVTSARFTADGQSILSTGVDGTVRRWGRQAGGEARRVNWEDGAISGARISSDDRLALLGNVNGSVRVIDMVTGTTRQTLTGHVGNVARVAVSPGGRLAISASWDRTARIWDLGVGRQVFELLGHADDILDVQFSLDGAKALSASRDGTACLWDVASGKKLLALSGHGGEVTSVQFSADGKTALTASSDSTARLWDLTNGALLKVLGRHEGVVHLARFFPDGKSAFTAGADGRVAVWDLTTGKQRFEFLGHRAPIVSARLSADGGRALTASWDSTARLWDTTSGRELQAMRGHAGAIHGALFSSDGSMALTFGADKTARLWDLPTGKELWVLRGHDGEVIDADFTADGRTIVTVGTDRTVRFWSCAACRPIDELAPELAARVGRNLSADERQRFGLLPASPQSR